MAPMPPSQFGSREELLTSAKEWAAHQGYAIVIARSRFNRLWLKCDRGGQYENRRNLTPDQRKRKRGNSRLLGCPFKMLAIVRKDGVWRVQTEIAEHNHGPSEDLSLHPTLRRLTEAQTQKVNDMTDAGNSPAETLEELRRVWPDIKVLTRDIYNARKKYKTQKEMAEVVAGLLPDDQPFEDPNGSFPGPTPHGRWEWVPDGEEVTSKNKKRKRKPPVEQQNLDPQLQSSASSQPRLFSTDHSPSNVGQNLVPHLRDTPAPINQNRTPSTGVARQDAGHGQFPHSSSFASVNDSPEFTGHHTEEESILPSQRSSRLRPPHPAQLPRSAAGTAVMSASAPSRPSDSGTPITGPSNAAQAAAPKVAQSGQVLMSRIERMEKEQRDQKNMLAQILGAVQGMHGAA